MLHQLESMLRQLPPKLQSAFSQIFSYQTARGQAVVPPAMQDWVIGQFGSVQAVEQQDILKISNRLTLEAALFNPLRARRPAGQSANDAELEQWIAAELRDAMFATPLSDTTADIFGRIHGQHCVTASNVAKYDAWHGLIIPKEPHPLHFTAEQVADYLATALRWIEAAHRHDPLAIYPMITWNCMPKSGATIVHGHWQVALTRGMHYSRVELWRRAAERYAAETGHDYWQALADIHQALGLQMASSSGTRAFAHLTPLRNRELVMLSDVHKTHADQGHALALSMHAFLRHFIDAQGMRAFNIGIALPALTPSSESWDAVPIITRLADRGPAITSRNDWGAMELYGSGVITINPFEMAASYRGDE